MKILSLLFLAVVGVEGISTVYDYLVQGKDWCGTRNCFGQTPNELVQKAVDLLGMKGRNSQKLAVVHRSDHRGSITTAALIGGTGSDAAVISFLGVDRMKAGRPSDTRYIKIGDNGPYRISEVICQHPYSELHINDPGAKPGYTNIAIMKIDRKRKLESPGEQSNPGTMYTGCDNVLPSDIIPNSPIAAVIDKARSMNGNRYYN